MAKFTLHNRHNGFMYDTARTLKGAKKKCDSASYKCKVFETYFAPSPFDKTKITEHGKEVYRNY